MLYGKRITLVAAMGRNRAIGHDGELPWHLPRELKHFRDTTMGKPIVMGRLTWRSIGRALPGRQNIVVSRDPAFEAPGCELARSLEEAIALARGEEVMVIGGEVTHAVRKSAKPGDFRVQDDHGGSVHAHTPTTEEIALAEAAMVFVQGSEALHGGDEGVPPAAAAGHAAAVGLVAFLDLLAGAVAVAGDLGVLRGSRHGRETRQGQQGDDQQASHAEIMHQESEPWMKQRKPCA